ncbi:fluoride efflux transporter FluC [Streptomyces sp. NBC_01190]|uniref:fluoride efflux transporter FluC n=1 Tax=Streptomyces sp. NBC_01190 TaxID=2903767 RepID=UPI0038653398|nr:CrcB family protein [Streptomyces sp. NBC_01190]
MAFDDAAHNPEPTGWNAEPTDPDTAIDPWPPRPGRGRRREQGEILAAIAAGGVLGAAARYGATLIWPTAPGTFPWTTFWINVIGCAAMGVLMVLITERRAVHPLTRPFLGTGVLGGFTTFSTATLDTKHLLDGHHPGTALVYAASTLAGAMVAIWATSTLTRLIAVPRTTGEGGRA